MKKKLLSVLIIFTMIFVVTGCNLETTEETTNTENNKEQEQTTNTEEQKNNNYEYMDALRKCSVMEAADIYTTGVGKKSDNVFNDGRETCESWYKQWGEKDFLEAVNEDWKNRQNEEIDGKPLSYYLDILGW
jgi:LAS superfamily LD-carboxypeptidase LdcB